MKWEQFLNDPELNIAGKYHSPPDGDYLFRKVVHDVLECLNAYKTSLEIAPKTNDSDIPDATFERLNRWSSVVEGWAEKIRSLAKTHPGKYLTTDPEWANVIGEIATIVETTPIFKSEMQSLTLPSQGKTREVIELAIIQTIKLELIRQDIQNQEYKRLWTITRYGDLVDGD